jgi:hypothetical protein|tara:strand:- start:82 stop:690 length:609 start_codon:yes stop_codon:yes gene_type:complete
MSLVIGSVYAGNLMYYSLIANSNQIILDVYENFKKQSYRNRCVIASPNGPLKLIIPIIRSSKNIVKDVKIDNTQNWKNIHWKSLESSYRSSPYFEFYEDEFYSLYFKNKNDFLFEFNNNINLAVLKCLGIETEIIISSSYVDKDSEIEDFRNLILPNSKYLEKIKEIKYNQVFQEKQLFLPNLSVLDLLFNEGPLAKQFLTH